MLVWLLVLLLLLGSIYAVYKFVIFCHVKNATKQKQHYIFEIERELQWLYEIIMYLRDTRHY